MFQGARRARVPRSATVSLVGKVKELKRAGVDVISLGAGEPGFVTPPHIRDFAKEALDEGLTFYPESSGLLELREAISEKLSRENGIDVDPRSEVLVTVGGKEAVFASVLALIDEGDEVLIMDPSWLTYEPCIRFAGGVPVPVALDEGEGYDLAPEMVDRAVTGRTRMIIINSPSNPTGGVISRSSLEAVAEIAVRRNLLVISDELYEYFIYDGSRHHSLSSLPGMEDRTITVNGFSKAYAMTGWRLGYMAADKRIIQAVMPIHEHSVTGPSTFIQKAASRALRDERSRSFVKEMVSTYERRRDILLGELGNMPGVSCVKPRGAFYAFPNTSSFRKGSIELADFLLDKARVATVPGVAFGSSGEGHLRLTFTNPEGELREACRRIGEALSAL